MSGRIVLDVAAHGWRLEVAAGEVVVLDGDVERAVAACDGTDRHARVHLHGRRLRGGVAARTRAGLAFVRDVPVAPDVTVRDHLAAAVGARAATAALGAAPLLAGRGDDRAGVLSGGERTVLSWLRASVLAPVAVLLERPTAGLDEATRAWASAHVRAWVESGLAILLVPGSAAERAWGDRPVTVPEQA